MFHYLVTYCFEENFSLSEFELFMINLEFIEGPIGFSNLDKVGVLTSGYDVRSTMMSWYSLMPPLNYCLNS